MGLLFGGASPPPPPPPPPAPSTLSAPGIQQAGQAEAAKLASAQGAGFNGTDVTGGQGAPTPSTTKTLLGG